VNRIGLGIGLIATVLVPIALLLFGVLKAGETLSAILLLSGAWTLVFGLLMEAKPERLYYSGFGIIVALLSTFHFIAFRYTAGLVVVAIVALAMASAVLKPRAPTTMKKL